MCMSMCVVVHYLVCSSSIVGRSHYCIAVIIFSFHRWEEPEGIPHHNVPRLLQPA